MYTEFYNLQEKPFDLTHSSRFLYLGEAHKEALAMLTYGVMERKGFVLLTGEVGTGKTTIVHALLAELDKSVQCVHLANPLLSPKELMNYLTLSAFKTRVTFKSKAEFLLAFEAFLTRCSQQQRSLLLLIDEAHKLSYELLEEIRLLSNMETAEEKLINIFLVGQPELNKKLSDQRCRALLQRISIRYQIKPLSHEGTESYIIRRLKVAGASKPDDILSGPVRNAIHEYSKGYPRMINILSDNLLLLGYARGARRLTPAMVRECFEDLKLEYPEPTENPAHEPERKIIEKKAEPRPSPEHSGFWKWAILALLAILLGAAAFFYGDEIRARMEKFLAGGTNPSSVAPPAANGEEPEPRQPNETAALPLVTPRSRQPTQHHTKATIPLPFEEAKKKDDSGSPSDPHLLKRPDVSPFHELAGPSALMGEGKGGGGKEAGDGGEEWVLGQPPEGDFGKMIIAKEGDIMERLARRIYGRVNDDILLFIQRNNPEIVDIDFIRTGQAIYFPALEESERSLR